MSTQSSQVNSPQEYITIETKIDSNEDYVKKDGGCVAPAVLSSKIAEAKEHHWRGATTWSCGS
ncbi:hypothetical protein EWB00_000385 [Schistosoma japonicum]|uniref:Uncharacterized protein n=1 Tax=Schistosoma japonicum TaxID=6182 RepID=A0A4Z2CKD9_SCHJA|nr:hypothetical protein EWB00_000385 [Schistosoma japonicum]